MKRKIVLGLAGFCLLSATASQVSQLTVSAAATTIRPGQTDQLTAAGGTPPYQFSVVAGIGDIDSASGVYTAPDKVDFPQHVLLRVQDSANSATSLTITVRN
jgi:hypothetical protein